MSFKRKVIWSEGMFLRPQHFQQQDRYVENLIEGRCAGLRPYPWGIRELSIDRDLLALGKFGVSRCRGVLPDGTPFSFPQDDEPPAPLDVPQDIKDTVVMLALPARRSGTAEVDSSDDPENLARYVPQDYDARDSNAGNPDAAPLQVGRLRLRLMLESEDHGAHACLGLARVVECRVDKNVVLDEGYLPPNLDCQAIGRLNGFLKELTGLLHHRGEALAGRVSASGRGGVAEIADFMLLQLVNRHEPMFSHLSEMSGLHPEELYRLGLALAGELATFTARNKRPVVFPPYRHDDLQATFEPLMADLRQSLSMVLEQNAIPLELQERKYGIRVSPITDRTLLAQASFVLAVSARMPGEALRSRFPTQVKIGPVERIRELVNLQLPGIPLRPLPVAPRQIPYHAGYTYFELDRNNEFWKQLTNSGGFAFHIAGEFPELELEFWAIKS